MDDKETEDNYDIARAAYVVDNEDVTATVAYILAREAYLKTQEQE